MTTGPRAGARTVWPMASCLLVLAACTATPSDAEPRTSAPTTSAPTTSDPTSTSTPTPAPTTSAAPAPTTPPAPAGPVPSDGRPRPATLTVPAIGLRDLAVVPYTGRTDDDAGTRIQDRGRAASPHGPAGGAGPGGIGNYQVTAHRLSSTKAFLDLPDLDTGDRVVVRSGGRRYVYEVRQTRETSFRSDRSLAEQRAAVPGRPGVRPTQAVITLSTCATPEDHAEGNYWSDRNGNPEHRIDKIGVLVKTT